MTCRHLTLVLEAKADNRRDCSMTMSPEEIDREITGLSDFVREEAVRIGILLSGYEEPLKDGRVRRVYWKDRSADENRGRELLCSLLRSGRPLTQDLRDRLAALVDPKDSQHPGIQRRIKFTDRRSGRRTNSFNDSLVAMHVYAAVKNGATIPAGVASTREKYGFKETSTVMKIWSRYRRILEEIHGSLDRPSRRKQVVPL